MHVVDLATSARKPPLLLLVKQLMNIRVRVAAEEDATIRCPNNVADISPSSVNSHFCLIQRDRLGSRRSGGGRDTKQDNLCCRGDDQDMRNRLDKHTRFRRHESDGGDGMGGLFEANELGVGMCVVPEEKGAIDRSPRVVDAREQAQPGGDCAAVQVLKYFVGDRVVCLDVEGSPRRVGVLNIIIRRRAGCASGQIMISLGSDDGAKRETYVCSRNLNQGSFRRSAGSG